MTVRSVNNAAGGVRSALRDLLQTPLSLHQERIRARYPSIDDILAGRCPVVLYPAAHMATQAAAALQARGVDVRGFSDGNSAKWGKTNGMLPVVAPEQIAALAPSGAVFVASSMYDSFIRERLAALGLTCVYPMPFLNHCLPDVFCSREYQNATQAPYEPGACDRILSLFDQLSDEPSQRVLADKVRYYLTLDKKLLDGIRSRQMIYFDSDIVRLQPDEVCVDCGAFTGDTMRCFLSVTGGRFAKYLAFEPDPSHFPELHASAATAPARIVCVRAGVSDQTGVLRFLVTGTVSTAVAAACDTAGVSLPVVDLDSYLDESETPTFIKMDIEGSEGAALRGAARVIARCRPVLAISAYHHPADLWDLPLRMTALAPGYKLYLRHYTREIDDTVCYAVPSDRAIHIET